MARHEGRVDRAGGIAKVALLVLCCGTAGCGEPARSEPELEDGSDACKPGCVATHLAAGTVHTCVLLGAGKVRCWGFGEQGQLGYAATKPVGHFDTPASAGDVEVGAVVKQLVAGAVHTCALLEDGNVRCWGLGGGGLLGHSDTSNIGDDEAPASAGNVDIGAKVTQIAAGGGHSCALLEDGNVRCWGSSRAGQLGYANTSSIADDETPASAGNVDVGAKVIHISAGGHHTCAVLEDGNVRCWGLGAHGRLGYANTNNIGDDETPASAGNVDLGAKATQVSAGESHTCALLEDGNVRCWGRNEMGQLGYANTRFIGDDETPASAGNVDVGVTLAQIEAGFWHTCARSAEGDVRCWGWGEWGQLGYADRSNIGDDEVPASAANVQVGATATQIAVGAEHNCVVLEDGDVRCWGWGGALGYGKIDDIGDDETPASAGSVPYR